MTDWLGYVCEINSVKFPSSNSRPNRVCFGRMNAESQARLYSREPSGPKLEVLGPKLERSEEVLTPLALQLLASLHRRFNPRRLELLAARAKRQALVRLGQLLVGHAKLLLVLANSPHHLVKRPRQHADFIRPIGVDVRFVIAIGNAVGSHHQLPNW